ncbi:MAG: MMPL family transporter [Actinomycetota bacterium]
MDRSRIYRTYDWINRHALIVTAAVVLTVIAIGGAGVVMADSDEPSFEPEGEIFAVDERVRTTLASNSTAAQATFLVESTDGGDVLTAASFREWKAATDRVRSSSENQAHLVDRFDPDTGATIPGVLSIVDIVDASLPDGLEAASDADVKFAVTAVLDDGAPFADMRHSLSESSKNVTTQSGETWNSPAFTTQVVYDTSTFGNSAAAEEWLRDVQAQLQEDLVHTDAIGVAIDGELTFSEATAGSAPYIFLAVALIILLIAVVHRSYWSAVVVAAGLAATTIAYYGTSALLGLKMGSMLLAFVVPIAAISFGVDFYIHGVGRVREMQVEQGMSRTKAYPAGMTAVFTALLLAASSSIAAFLANASSGTEAIVEFGIGAAIALGWSYVLLGQIAPRVLLGIEGFVGANPVKGVSKYVYAAAMVAAAVTGGVAVALAAIMTGPGIAAFLTVLVLLIGAPALLTRRRNRRAALRGTPTQIEHRGAAHGLESAGSFVRFLAKWRVATVPAVLAIGGLAFIVALQVESGFEITDFLSTETDFVRSVERVDEHFPSSGDGSGYVFVEGDLTNPAALVALDNAVEQLDTSDAAFGRNGGGDLLVDLHAGDLVQMTLASPAAVETISSNGVELGDADRDGYPDSPTAIRAVYDYIAVHGVPLPDGSMALPPAEVPGVLADDGATSQATAIVVMIRSFTDGDIILPAERALIDAAGSVEAAVPGLEASVSGGVLANYYGLAAFTRSMMVSLPLAVLLTLILASLLLRSFRYALVSVVPIAFVVTGVYAFMAIAGYTVNVVTATIAAIAVGVGIDFSTHFTARYREELANAPDRLEAVRRAGEGTGGALVLSALTSVLGFTVMAVAPTPIFATFGTLTAVMIGLALIASLVVLPSLLVIATPCRTQSAPSERNCLEDRDGLGDRELVGV